MPQSFRRITTALAALALVAGAGAIPAAAQTDCTGVAPYVFFLLDTSSSMNRSAPCTQAQFNAGECAFVCAGSECSTPTAGDHAGSKIYQTRQALYQVLSGLSSYQFGFATMNQDTLSVRAKHWLYEAASAGPTIMGWGPYPSIGSREAFGQVWSCGSGTGDSGVGCSAAAPADLPDAWERARVQRLPKGGLNFSETVQLYVRNGTALYRILYSPVPGGVPGGPLQTNVTAQLCANNSCSAISWMDSQVVSWTPVTDFLSFDSAASTPSRTAPETWFPESAAADAAAIYPQCASSTAPGGWDPNTDDTADAANGYDLRWPTDSSDGRGAVFSRGDVVPLDWLNDHRDDLLARLAPNTAADPLAAPDFRTATYFQDSRQGSDLFLRLRNESARPLVATGPTAIGRAVSSFRQWFAPCTNPSLCVPSTWVETAATADPLWVCRRKYLVVVSDGGETCVSSATSPSADVAYLNSHWGVKTFVFAVGVAPNSDTTLKNLSVYGKGLIYYPQTRQQLVDNLNSFFLSIQP